MKAIKLPLLAAVAIGGSRVGNRDRSVGSLYLVRDTDQPGSLGRIPQSFN